MGERCRPTLRSAQSKWTNCEQLRSQKEWSGRYRITLTRKMTNPRGINDLPTGVLCDIMQRCCDNSIYNLATLRAVSKTFRASVSMVRAYQMTITHMCSQASLHLGDCLTDMLIPDDRRYEVQHASGYPGWYAQGKQGAVRPSV